MEWLVPKRKPAGKDEIIKLLSEGWEIRGSSGAHASRYWLVNDKADGGLMIDAHGGAINALFLRRKIESMPRRKTDPFWLTRYRLKEKP